MTSSKKKYLFFFVHPSKYYLFRYTINYLKQEGHDVEIAIISKDVLEELVKNEGWHYTNIFPEGRQSKSRKSLSICIITILNFIRTIYRLHKLTKNKKYDLFITDDCLVIIGWYRRIPSIFFTDNELSTIPETRLLLKFSDIIIAPQCVKLGKFESKKVGFKGYKELAYLAPNYFVPDPEILDIFNPNKVPYSVIRLVGMTASHDRGLKGISEEQLKKLIKLLEKHGKVFISSEAALNNEFNKYVIKIAPQNIFHVLYFADLFIGDSGTMASEAAVLGTPSIMYHKFVNKLSVMKEKEEKFGLMFGFNENQFDEMLFKILELFEVKNLKESFKIKVKRMLFETEDVNMFIIRLLENY